MGMEFLKYAVIITVVVVGIAAYLENNKFKASSYGKQSKSTFWKVINNKGTHGEYRMSQVLDTTPFEKKLIYNVYLPKKKEDETTEVDIIMISSKGIYVIENKNYAGWIFGNEKDQKWCETLKGKKYFFYNPIKQNNTHIKYLENLLQIGNEKYTSLITFNLAADLKKVTVESENIHVIAYNNLSAFLEKEKARADCLTSEEINKIYDTLLPLTQVTEEQKQEHIKTIQDKYKK